MYDVFTLTFLTMGGYLHILNGLLSTLFIRNKGFNNGNNNNNIDTNDFTLNQSH